MNLKAFIRPSAGAADISLLLRDGAAFRAAIEELAGLFANAAIDRVACIEGRGFLIGSAVAFHLGVGVVPLRDPLRLKAAGPVHVERFVDYSRMEKALTLPADAIAPGDRVLIVDDWVETGATMRAAVALVQRTGGVVTGLGAPMDDTAPAVRSHLQTLGFRALLRAMPGDRF